MIETIETVAAVLGVDARLETCYWEYTIGLTSIARLDFGGWRALDDSYVVQTHPTRRAAFRHVAELLGRTSRARAST